MDDGPRNEKARQRHRRSKEEIRGFKAVPSDVLTTERSGLDVPNHQEYSEKNNYRWSVSGRAHADVEYQQLKHQSSVEEYSIQRKKESPRSKQDSPRRDLSNPESKRASPGRDRKPRTPQSVYTDRDQSPRNEGARARRRQRVKEDCNCSSLSPSAVPSEASSLHVFKQDFSEDNHFGWAISGRAAADSDYRKLKHQESFSPADKYSPPRSPEKRLGPVDKGPEGPRNEKARVRHRQRRKVDCHCSSPSPSAVPSEVSNLHVAKVELNEENNFGWKIYGKSKGDPEFDKLLRFHEKPDATGDKFRKKTHVLYVDDDSEVGDKLKIKATQTSLPIDSLLEQIEMEKKQSLSRKSSSKRFSWGKLSSRKTSSEKVSEDKEKGKELSFSKLRRSKQKVSMDDQSNQPSRETSIGRDSEGKVKKKKRSSPKLRKKSKQKVYLDDQANQPSRETSIGRDSEDKEKEKKRSCPKLRRKSKQKFSLDDQSNLPSRDTSSGRVSEDKGKKKKLSFPKLRRSKQKVSMDDQSNQPSREISSGRASEDKGKKKKLSFPKLRRSKQKAYLDDQSNQLSRETSSGRVSKDKGKKKKLSFPKLRRSKPKASLDDQSNQLSRETSSGRVSEDKGKKKKLSFPKMGRSKQKDSLDDQSKWSSRKASSGRGSEDKGKKKKSSFSKPGKSKKKHSKDEQLSDHPISDPEEYINEAGDTSASVSQEVDVNKTKLRNVGPTRYALRAGVDRVGSDLTVNLKPSDRSSSYRAPSSEYLLETTSGTNQYLYINRKIVKNKDKDQH